jgi:hypothetical protein
VDRAVLLEETVEILMVQMGETMVVMLEVVVRVRVLLEVNQHFALFGRVQHDYSHQQEQQMNKEIYVHQS